MINKSNRYFIDFENSQQDFVIDEDEVLGSTYKMLDYILNNESVIKGSVLEPYDLDRQKLCFDLLICDNDQIHQINKEYRQKDKPTDVITFALFADSPQNRIIADNLIHLGQVIISAQKAEEQTKENEKSFDDEILFLLCHGVLHLLGFDHPDEESLKFMLDLQDEMISYVKV